VQIMNIRRSATPGRSATSSRDWTVQATDTIERCVALVRDRATVPVRTAARAVVYGIALRLVVAYLPAGKAPTGAPRVWVAYVLIGGILTIGALFLLRKAERVARESE
jgi:hypothetical protein